MLWTATAVTGGRCRPVSGYPRYNDIMYGVEHRAQVEMLEWWEMNRDAGDGSRSGDPVTNGGLE